MGFMTVHGFMARAPINWVAGNFFISFSIVMLGVFFFVFCQMEIFGIVG